MSDNIHLGPGRLFIGTPDGAEYLGNVYELETVESTYDMEPWPKENPFLTAMDTAELTCSLKMAAQSIQKIIDAMLGITKAVLELCPDKRVVHLARHARKERTRKKNRRRAYRLLMKEGPPK